jgi:group I intron endonuclease
MNSSNQKKEYFFVYKTTNKKNGKFYIGIHSTKDLNDGYLGSGTLLKSSIKKNGKENFKFEYLEFFENYDDLREAEKKLVNEELLKNPKCLNLVYGGGGGFISPKGAQKGGIVAGKIRKERLENNPEEREKYIESFRQKRKEWQLEGKLKTPPNWTGKKHREESKSKIGEANSQKQRAEGNSQFGTCWITNGTENKKIKKTEKLPKGWEFGRKIKVI